MLSAGDSLKIKLFGRGSHGSQPQTSIDPVIMAAATDAAPADHRLARDRAARQRGADDRRAAGRHEGEHHPRRRHDQAEHAHLRRGRARAHAVGDPPHLLRRVRRLPRREAARVHHAQQLSADRERRSVRAARGKGVRGAVRGARFETPPASASEDFSVFGRAWGVPYVFWFVGGTDPSGYAKAKRTKTVNALPSNHSPKFAPVIHPTLRDRSRGDAHRRSAWLCPLSVVMQHELFALADLLDQWPPAYPWPTRWRYSES